MSTQIRLMSALAAAISLLERGDKKAAASDKMFDQMLVDYKKVLEDARAELKPECEHEFIDDGEHLLVCTKCGYQEDHTPVPGVWYPIEDIAGMEQNYVSLLLYSPKFVDLDFNPEGVIEGHFQDEGGWTAAIWNNDQDCFDTVMCLEPTHYMIKSTPK